MYPPFWIVPFNMILGIAVALIGIYLHDYQQAVTGVWVAAAVVVSYVVGKES